MGALSLSAEVLWFVAGTIEKVLSVEKGEPSDAMFIRAGVVRQSDGRPLCHCRFGPW